jgi:hypothetical protein
MPQPTNQTQASSHRHVNHPSVAQPDDTSAPPLASRRLSLYRRRRQPLSPLPCQPRLPHPELSSLFRASPTPRRSAPGFAAICPARPLPHAPLPRVPPTSYWPHAPHQPPSFSISPCTAPRPGARRPRLHLRSTLPSPGSGHALRRFHMVLRQLANVPSQRSARLLAPPPSRALSSHGSIPERPQGRRSALHACLVLPARLWR